MVQSIPVTDAVQDRHVEQIIISGSPFISSMYGSEAHLVTAPSIPVFYGAPIITGSLLRLSTLLCSEGAFHSSPRAVATYQWKKDNVDIGGETTNSYTTFMSDIDAVITCLVTATNASGNDSLISNGVTIEDIIPSSIFELDTYFITGLDAPGRVDLNEMFLGIVTGIAQAVKVDVNMGITNIITGFQNPDKIDVNDQSANIVTGFASLDKVDIDEIRACAITGFASLDKVDINEIEACVITGLTSPDKVDINEIGAYITFNPTFLTPLVVVNGDAENSSMSDWNMDTGNVTSVTSALGYSTNHREGLRFFKADDLGQGVNSQMSQVITIPGGDLTDVDLGKTYCVARFIHMSDQGFDKLTVTLKALNAADSVLATTTYNAEPGPDDHWVTDSTQDDPLNLPTLTRKVKITILFDAHASSGDPENSVYADDFAIDLMKIE